jgi:hypothetical protein
MQNRPFRPCAMMLGVKSSEKLKPARLSKSILDRIENYLMEECINFDSDCGPDVVIKGEIFLPIKAPHNLLIMPFNEDLRSYFELGFIAQQLMLYLSYLRLSYCLVITDKGAMIPFSSDGKIIAEKKITPNFVRQRMVPIEETLYFEKWGDHPEDFFKDNHKLESIVRYARFAPRIEQSRPLRFIMDRENIHLLVTDCNGSEPYKDDMINAGFILLNFIISAGMLKLMGEWKLLREIDQPDRDTFELPDNVRHIATWHGQLY